MWKKPGSCFSVSDHALPHFQPVLSSEHMAALGVFGLCQIHAFVDYLRSKLNPQQFEILFRSVISLVGFVLLSVGAVLMLTGSHCKGVSPSFLASKSTEFVHPNCVIVAPGPVSPLNREIGTCPNLCIHREYLSSSCKTGGAETLGTPGWCCRY